MDILVLGGTGAMGAPLVRQLAQEANVYVTTRRNTPPYPQILYIMSLTFKGMPEN